jgi:hypothetical protein
MRGRELPHEEARAVEETERERRAAEAKAARRSFPRLRLNVTALSPGYVTCSLFQSDNAGTNWGCVGTGVTFPEDWFEETFGGLANGDVDVGKRIEFTITGAMEVEE